MKKPSIAWVLAAIIAGSAGAEDIVYSTENFEGGTPNYIITGTGPYTLTQLVDGSSTSISSTTALAGTAYTPGSPSRSGVFANDDLPGVITGEPAGQHGFVSGSANRSLTLQNPLSLDTDGVGLLTIGFDTMVYGLDDGADGPDFTHTVAVYYSALGDFTDSVAITTYSPAAVPDPGLAPTHFTVVEDTWTTLNVPISSTDVTFTDTAKIRFNKLAPYAGSQMVFYDNITITGTPAPVADIPFVATISPAVSPDTGYDLQWTSLAGMTYSVLTSTELATPVGSWTVVQAGIEPTPPQNSYNLPANGPRRFYVVKETPVP